MSRKPKFKPEVTRIKLNPEQAVLQCACYNSGWNGEGKAHPSEQGCDLSAGKVNNYKNSTSGAVSS